MSTDPTFDGISPEVAELLAAARATTPATPDTALLSSMAVAVGTGSLGETTTTPRRKKLIGKLITAKAFGIVGVLALTGGAAAAATGTLPDPIQDTAANVADVVGVQIPKSNHGSEVSPVARDKSGDDDAKNHGETVSDTARDNHGHNKGDDTTTTTVGGDDSGSSSNSGPGKSTSRGKADDHSSSGKHSGDDDPADHDANDDDSTTSTTIRNTTATTVDDHGGGKNSGKGKTNGQNDDGADHDVNDDHGSDDD